MGGLYFGNQYFKFKEIGTAESPTEAGNFREAFEFCKSYQAGTESFILKTSGSTGKPKPIKLTREQLNHSARGTIEALDLKPDYKCLMCISVAHIGGIMMLVRAMELGMDLHFKEPSGDLDIKGLPGIDFVALVPLQLKSLVARSSGHEFLKACKSVIVGGASIDPSIEDDLKQFEISIYHTFGMTETASHIAMRKISSGPSRDVYHVIQDVKISTDDRGCLLINGVVTNNQPVQTNDMVEILGPKKFKWLGRWDNVINTGGLKVYPYQLDKRIKDCLSTLNLNINFILLGLPDRKWGEKVTLVLEIESINPLIEAELQRQFKSCLEYYQIPKVILCMPKFPRTVGKVNVVAVKERLINLF